MIPAGLKRKILTAAGAGALAVAGVLVTHFEPARVRGKPYLDPVGILTVCDGHTGGDIDPKRIYTDAECDAWRDADLAEAKAVFDRWVPAAVRDGMQATAVGGFISFIFNVGPGKPGVKDGFVWLKNGRHSTMLMRLQAGDIKGACAQLDAWIKAGGRVLPGLVTRREAEEWSCLLP